MNVPTSFSKIASTCSVEIFAICMIVATFFVTECAAFRPGEKLAWFVHFAFDWVSTRHDWNFLIDLILLPLI